MAPVEIYTTPFCPYCHCGQGAADAQRRRLHRDRRHGDRGCAPADGRARATAHTVPQIFIGATHVGGSDDLYALEDAGKLDPLLAAGEGQPSMSAQRLRPSRSASSRCARGSTPHANLDAAGALIGEAKRGRRRLRADAGDDQHHGAQARAAVRRDRARRSTTRRSRAFRELGAQARHLPPHRLAGDQGLAGQGGQPLLPDRPARRHRRALRQDPHVRRRSRQRRELSRVAQLPAGRARHASPTCPGAGSASPSATTCAFRRSTARSPRPARRSSRSPPPSPGRPAKRIGTC